MLIINVEQEIKIIEVKWFGCNARKKKRLNKRRTNNISNAIVILYLGRKEEKKEPMTISSMEYLNA